MGESERQKRLSRAARAIDRGVTIKRACVDAGIPYHVWQYWRGEKAKEATR